MRAHVDHTFQAEFCADGGSCHAVLTRPSFSNNTGFAHTARQNNLAQDVVNFMRAGVVQLVTLEVDFCTTKVFGQPFSIIQRAGTANIVGPQIVHFGPERVVGFGELILLFQLEDQRHQGFGHKAPTKIAKAPLFIRAIHEAVKKFV